MKKVFMLVDCNNFFVSCERLFDPQSRHVPAVVFSNNEGCVIARSNEAKTIGIKMAEPVFECKELLDFFKVRGFATNFSLYSDISGRVMDILKDVSSQFEPYSVDEAFLEITHLNISNHEQFAREIKEKIYKLVGIPVSVGIAPTKTLAKIASKMSKKADGICVLLEDFKEKIKEFPLRDVWGIGYATNKELKKMGITNIEQFLQLQPNAVLRRFGVSLLRTWWELKGESALGVNSSNDIPKSMMHTRTFKGPIQEKEELRSKLISFACDISSQLRVENLLCLHISVFLREGKGSSSYYGSGLSTTFEEHTNLRTDLSKKVGELFEKLFVQGKKYKKGGVFVSGIIKKGDKEFLFQQSNPSKDMAERGVDILNARWKNIVSLGSIPISKHEVSLLKSPEYTTNWHQLRVVF